MDKIFKNFMTIAGGTLVNMVIGVLTTPIITRNVDPVEYGQFSLFTMYAGIASMILCLGLDQAMVRFFYELDTKSYKRELLWKCIQPSICITIVILCICFFLERVDILRFELAWQFFLLLCMYIFILVIHRFSLLLIRLQYKTKLYSLIMITQKILYIIFAIPMLILSDFEHVLVLVWGTILAGAVCVIVCICSEKDIWKTVFLHKQTNNISRKKLLKYAYPYIFSMGITMFFQAVDQISLSIFCSYKEVGIYASTMSLIHIFAIVQTAFNTVWAPASVEYFTKNKEKKDFYIKGNQGITVIMFFIGITVILFKDIFSMMLGEKFREAAYILPFLIFNPIMYTISETTVSGIVFAKKSRMHIVVAIVACTTNIIGNVVLVPNYGCRGAAISTGIAYIVFFSLRTWISNRYFYIDFGLKKFYFLTFVVCVYALYNTFFEFTFISIVGYAVCLAVLIVSYREIILYGLKQFLKIEIK